MSEAEAQAADGTATTIGEALEEMGESKAPLQVRLSRELITLLSEQLYTSPSKAVEELVVNAFDADAPNCWVSVPEPGSVGVGDERAVVAVLDNGVGMDVAGLTDLWRVGSSTKRNEQVERARARKQIGKFGIGKLATYALASQITYVTCTGDGAILSVTLAYEDFEPSPRGASEDPVELQVAQLSVDQLNSFPQVRDVLTALGEGAGEVIAADRSWTLVMLERLKPTVGKLTPGRLRWVLSTALPIAGFDVRLNGGQIESSKLRGEVIAELEIRDLPQGRIDRLREATDVEWAVKEFPNGDGNSERRLWSVTLPNGISGRAIVTDQTIYGGKSRDLIRSHGFFVRVRGRLISEDDPLFGNNPLSYEVFNRFRADINCDDLDEDITAPREGTATTDRAIAVQEVLLQVFYELQTRYRQHEKDKHKQETRREEERNYVFPRLVERPIADAVLRNQSDESDLEGSGADADETWFYLKGVSAEDAMAAAMDMYSMTSRDRYNYTLEERGREARLVEFDLLSRTFTVNADHELALAFKDNRLALDLLYDVATAETLLEVYLREAIPTAAIAGELLERRDGLFRALAREQVTAPAAIAAALRDAVSSERDLEIAVVVAARSLGFVAKHVGNAGRADGVARFRDFETDPIKITLEAKSSESVPTLGAIDFAGLQRHMLAESAAGCLLVAPAYPGASKEDNAAAETARNLRISCWTVEQLARVVEALRSRDITARHVLDIVETCFAPDDVASAVGALLEDPTIASREVVVQILTALRDLETRVPRLLRSRDLIIGTGLVDAPPELVETALTQMAEASAGAMVMLSSGKEFKVNTSMEELERRLSGWANNDSSARRASRFRGSTGHRQYDPDVATEDGDR